MPIEDLLDTLPQNMLKRITGEAHSDGSDDEGSGSEDDENSEDEDADR